ncbi:MAG: peptidoglycan-associated lipoprotein Pal [Deltaproteobacteria bacterium]|nr:peptidoglycan-associated lipoprotein Pal [Deltaproteobacteria bacterium]
MTKRHIWTVVWLVGVMALAACQNKKAPTTSYVAPPPAKGLQTVYYDFDKSNVRDDQVSSLENNAAVLKANAGTQTTIEGHCDERGTNEYNLALGDRRARSAKNFEINLGIDPNRMTTISYGEERPVCTQHDESCWWQNRRAAFVK